MSTSDRFPEREGRGSLIKPFRRLRSAPGRARDVLAPPYDVLSSAEARERAAGKPWSFLHISKPEIDRKSTRLNSSHANISYAVFCLKKKTRISRLLP